MRKIFALSLLIIGLGIVLLSISHKEPPRTASSTVEPLLEKEVQYKSYTLESSVVHTLLIPGDSRFLVIPAVSQELSSLESFAQKHEAVAVINGGFFDPQNQESTSYVVQQGVLVADPRKNERLMDNPKLAPYLEKILDRTEFRRYRCGLTVGYDIALHSEPTPKECQLVDALGGSPRLLPEITSVAEGFLDVENGLVIRDSLNSRQSNARSAVGITRDRNILLVMVAQQPLSQTSGMSLAALADFMKTLGVEKAMNLDGGSSSSFYYKGKTFYGKVGNEGNPLRRPVLSVLLVKD
ncbi:MAG: phosphodiester glycosidase family protein [Symplocastrum torsivum CPER-KK1]|uniref:Phosphodiester glycosidase family protein n=1 Tax=Symplocastrum torsivum CPER-KK1 TaxID=450513 RepID=A0A951UBG9_9CYAN|nr:phosphodiester glycosidase family protein [Symplocastrum torsivum CPER-KK1]